MSKLKELNKKAQKEINVLNEDAEILRTENIELRTKAKIEKAKIYKEIDREISKEYSSREKLLVKKYLDELECSSEKIKDLESRLITIMKTKAETDMKFCLTKWAKFVQLNKNNDGIKFFSVTDKLK